MNSPRLRWSFALMALSVLCVPAARAQNPLLELVTDQVSEPIYVTNAGGDDERLFIVERAGRIRIVQNGALLPTPFLDISSLVDTSGEGGLLSIAFHPDYSNDANDPRPARHWVYVSYTGPGTGGNALTSVIARYSLSGDPNVLDPASGRTLLTVGQPGTNHNGGQIQFSRLNRFLYIGFGDGGTGAPACVSQAQQQELGKMLRLDVDLVNDAAPWFEVPTTNPYYDAPDPNDPNAPGDGILDTIWAFGLRNPWRFSFDRTTGDLWIGDVGQNSREEIDIEGSTSIGGRNYGWSVKEGTQCLISGNPASSGCPVGTPSCNSPEYAQPNFEYPHDTGGAVSITGGYVYRGGRAPAFLGKYIFGDFGTGELYWLEPGILNFQREVLSSGDLTSPASFGEDSDGELYVADIATNRVYRLRLDLVALEGSFKCIDKMNAKTAKFADLLDKELQKCVSAVARNRRPPLTADECLDPVTNAKVKNGASGVFKVDEKACLSDAPPFGYSGYAASVGTTLLSEEALISDLLGPDLETAVATEKSAAKCQSDVLKGAFACQRARRSEFVRCKKSGIKAETLQSAGDIALCLGADPKGKVAKVCDPASSKLAVKTIPKSCVDAGVDLSDAFPGCASDDAALLAQCIDAAGRCRDCEWASGVDELGLDCAAECGAAAP